MSDTLPTDASLAVGQSLESPSGRYKLILQSDGNLVLYQEAIAVANAYWSSATDGLPEGQRPVRLTMQSDAHLVLYDQDSVPRWASGTWGQGFVNPRLVLQDDGNLVIYHRGNEAVWATGTTTGAGRIPARGHVSAGGPSPSLTQTEHTNLGANHFMDTTARLQRTGHIDATTRTQTGTLLGGFTGGVSLLLVDASGIVIGSTPQHAFGVDGRIIGRSDRTDFWIEDVDPGVAARTEQLVVLHFWAPKWNALETLLHKAVSSGQLLVQLLSGLGQSGLLKS